VNLSLIYNNYQTIMSGNRYVEWNKYIPSSKRKRVYIQERYSCSVIAGVQECGICSEEAYYSTDIFKRNHLNYPQMSLFRCGHGICEYCVFNILEAGKFRCPYCRDGGSVVLTSFCSNQVKCQQNTLEDYLCEWRYRIGRALRSGDKFIKLHNQIVSDYKVDLQGKLIKKQKSKKENQRKKVRKKSREKAICPICNKDTFTSEKQLDIHMSKKHRKSSKI
jgi:hypothetical protein